jgi:adenylylsulfate kinase-like enzyme
MIIMFCGIPGSGKSTVAQILHRQLSDLGHVQVLSSDQLRGPVYRKLLKTLAPDRERPDFIIFDATFYKKEWRQQVSAMAGGDPVITVYFECPLNVALERNRQRRPNVSEKALHIMFHKMERPENPTITIDTVGTTAVDASAKILNVIKDKQPGHDPGEEAI